MAILYSKVELQAALNRLQEQEAEDLEHREWRYCFRCGMAYPIDTDDPNNNICYCDHDD